MALTNHDGSQFLMAKNESILSKSDYPVPSYFEFKVIKDGNIVIELKTNQNEVKCVFLKYLDVSFTKISFYR